MHETHPYEVGVGFVRIFLLRRVPYDERARLFILRRHERAGIWVVQAEVPRPLSRNSDSSGDALIIRLYNCLDATDIFGPGRYGRDLNVWLRFVLSSGGRQG